MPFVRFISGPVPFCVTHIAGFVVFTVLSFPKVKLPPPIAAVHCVVLSGNTIHPDPLMLNVAFVAKLVRFNSQPLPYCAPHNNGFAVEYAAKTPV